MFCVKCQTDLEDCKCPDLQERLKRIASGGNIIMRWCANCDKHYSKCKCEKPQWTTKGGDKKNITLTTL